MKYRAFRRSSDGAYLDVVFTTDGEFGSPPESQAADLGAAVGAVVEAVEGDSDPRVGVLIPLPAPPAPAAAVSAFALIADKLDSLAAVIRANGRGSEADKMAEVAKAAREAPR